MGRHLFLCVSIINQFLHSPVSLFKPFNLSFQVATNLTFYHILQTNHGVTCGFFIESKIIIYSLLKYSLLVSGELN